MEGAGMRCESPLRRVHLWRHFSCVQDGIFIAHLRWCKLLILLMFLEKNTANELVFARGPAGNAGDELPSCGVGCILQQTSNGSLWKMPAPMKCSSNGFPSGKS